MSALLDGIGERADARDPDADRITGAQRANPGGGAGCNNIAGQEGHDLGNEGQQLGNRPDQVGDRGMLDNVVIQAGRDGQGSQVDLIGQDRAIGAKVSKLLARVHWPSFFSRSRAVTSFRQV